MQTISKAHLVSCSLFMATAMGAVNAQDFRYVGLGTNPELNTSELLVGFTPRQSIVDVDGVFGSGVKFCRADEPEICIESDLFSFRVPKIQHLGGGVWEFHGMRYLAGRCRPTGCLGRHIV